jgi:hypothetical protein
MSIGDFSEKGSNIVPNYQLDNLKYYGILDAGVKSVIRKRSAELGL